MNLGELLKNQDGLEEERKDVSQDQLDEEGELLSDVNVIQLVSFLLDEVEYGIDILSVHEILRLPDIARLPNTPSFIKGVINLRGNVIPVVDVRNRFSLPETEVTDLTRIVVIETNDKLVGILVDNVYQVVRVPESNIDSPSELVEGVSEEFIQGIARLTDKLVVILNLDNILFSEDEK